MKPLSQYKSVDEWKEDMEKDGQKVNMLVYITLSKIMEDRGCSLAEAFSYMNQTGQIINKEGLLGETPPEDGED